MPPMPDRAAPARDDGAGVEQLAPGGVLCLAAAADAIIDAGAATVAPRRMLAPSVADDALTSLRRDRHLTTVAPFFP
jgi:hypothetical protein